MISSNTLGRYQIVREIARSNDIVYEARDPVMGRRVALKELAVPPNLQGAARRDRIERFYREAKAAGSLTHPNIVTIYEVGEDHCRHFIAMEFLEGQSLRDVLQVRGALPVPEALRIARAIASALHYAHQHGVIHRDVKPDNVHLLPDGGIKLTDFGIARLMFEASLTADGQVFGTPSYMSPEQVAGKALDPRSDLFSLGVMLYEMVSGRKPFTGDSVVTITYNIMNLDPATPPGVPPAIQAIIRRAMAKDPAQRYPDAGAMGRDLEAPPTPPPQSFGAATMAPFPPGPARPVPGPQVLTLNPLAGLRPDDLVLAPPPAQPMFRRPRARLTIPPALRAWIGAILLSMVAAMVVLFGIWGTMVAYQNYESNANRQVAMAHFTLASKAFYRGDYDQATREFLRASEISPGSDVGRTARHNAVNAALEIGTQRENQGDAAGAESAYMNVLRIDPENPAAYARLAAILFNVGQRSQAFAYWDRAITNWNRELSEGRLDPDEERTARHDLAVTEQTYGRALYQQGEELYMQRRNAEAIQLWQRVIEVAPGTPEAMWAQSRLNTVGSAGMGIFPSTMGAAP